MARKHLFPLVVLLAAAAVAGVLALSRTVALGQAGTSSANADTSIAYRLEELDRFEASLREQLARSQPGSAPTRTVYRRAAAASDADDDAYEHDDEHEDDHEDAGRDD